MIDRFRLCVALPPDKQTEPWSCTRMRLPSLLVQRVNFGAKGAGDAQRILIPKR
jgi:hypothetical protein